MGLTALLVVILVGAVTAGRQMRMAARASALRAENADFRRQLSRMAEMEDRVRSLEATRRALVQLIGAGDENGRYLEPPATAAGSVWAGATHAAADPDSVLSEEQLAGMRSILRLAPLRGPKTRSFGRIGSTGYLHTGTDIAADVGAEITSPGDGVASFVGGDEIMGQLLVISHEKGIDTMYGHNSRILVKVGDGISVGQTIALVGNTGRSTAPHLHFEVHLNGKPIDPELVYPDYWQ
ncbi:MAG: peptidoglycan DD-metalloendopeptidase family protein [Candidatus Eisenbacteria bacterium]|uniref:Peptidoglycan DD-metalloendopeptidase family protein n=1 Tax=Eiseniibacteriota bacterium TaxID=2212470 RepID=A0A937X6D5_UNCEI|nr:peptidoglycan DD-metalloendopeptidase family protein [Candidatus Eisenbacteria bacterium]